MTCDVVRDLLPLYVDGACSKDSHEIVKEHLKDCPYCARQFKEMLTPLAIPELSSREIKVQKAFKKIWSSFLVGIILLTIVSVTVSVVNYINFRYKAPGDRVTTDNWDDVKIVEKVMSDWLEFGIEEAVGLMQPVELYLHLSAPLTDGEVNEWAGQSFAENSPEFVSFEVDEQIYSMLLFDEEADFPWINPVTQEGLDMEKALETKDFTGFWHSFMLDCEGQIIVTQDIYKAVTDKYNDIDEEGYHKLELTSGTYYYYDKADENGNKNIWYMDFSKDMYEKVKELEPIGDEFFILVKNKIMPEELCLKFMEEYEQVYSKLDEYAKYYQELGYYDFAKAWREKIKTTITELEAQGITLESYEIDYDEGIFQPANPEYYGWRVICKATFSNGKSVYLYFDVNNGRCTLDNAGPVYWEGITEEEKEELEEFTDSIYQSLDYRKQVIRE